MEKVFKCQLTDEFGEIKVSVGKTKDCINLHFENDGLEISEYIFLSKPDAIEFCRELLKQIAMLE